MLLSSVSHFALFHYCGQTSQILWISYRHLPSASNTLVTGDIKFTITPDLGLNLIPLRLIRVPLLSANTKPYGPVLEDAKFPQL